MRLLPLSKGLPGWKNALLALLSAILLVLAFPDFDYWFLAWFALVPLMWAVEREMESTSRSFVLGWIFGTVFFFSSCWWLTYAPITYAGFPPILAYFLLFCVCLVAGLFPAAFAGILSFLLRRFGSLAFLAAPFVWVFTEFLRYWMTGNNWNGLGYSQAWNDGILKFAATGGVWLSSALVLAQNVLCGGFIYLFFLSYYKLGKRVYANMSAIDEGGQPAWISTGRALESPIAKIAVGLWVGACLFGIGFSLFADGNANERGRYYDEPNRRVIAIQPNVPMSGLNEVKWNENRRRHMDLAEAALAKIVRTNGYVVVPPLVIFPESPMNFMYETDRETRDFIDGFAKKNNVSVLFNSAEPDAPNGKFYNSAVMVGPQGGEVAQYDKIYLLPFGEAVPFPLEGILPGFVGNFSYGREYDLLPLGDAKAGVMICFESHFGQLSREYVRNGADAIIEMTNDGYLGPTPVLRQHLANAVFRAVETNRPVLRVTNVGITAYINERGEVLDPAQPYTEDTRVWSVARSDGTQTFYVRYGDWFAWLCTLVTLALVVISLGRRISPNGQEVEVQLTAIS